MDVLEMKVGHVPGEKLRELADQALGNGRIEPIPDPDAWTDSELDIMRRRGQYIYPNRRIARETRLECLRLAAQSGMHPDHVLKFAEDYENYVKGMVRLEPLKAAE